MSRKDLEEAYAKIHAQKEKQEKKDKAKGGSRYSDLSRNELEKAIERELGHKLDKKYDNMSKNELRQELAKLKDRPNGDYASISTQSNKNLGPGNASYADNCVKYLRNVENINLPPKDLTYWSAKKSIINSS
mgnify:CR=1 FL=1|uniref:Uncharacterized protein n=1 Tax=Desulfobacca acetoxidans TaxID=60893 RepID=A0A7V4G9W7_9BACT